jgi:sulfatase maturation enzyme AslB (radical SAM superfamily)
MTSSDVLRLGNAMVQQKVREGIVDAGVMPFRRKLNAPLTKNPITVLQINLGKRCNLACSHCHVEASPKRTEELSPEICDQLIELIHRFPQIKIVDLTWRCAGNELWI